MKEPSAHDLVEGFRAAVRAAEPGAAVRRSLTYVEGVVSVDGVTIGRFAPDHITVIGVGKAAGAMADAAAQIVGTSRGMVVTPYGVECALPVFVGGHPIPSEASLVAGRALLDTVGALTSEDLVIAVVSGGGSAAAEVLVPEVSLGDLETMNAVLVGSGAPIEEINQVRAAVSQLKAGGLRNAARPATVVTLVLSDVVNGGPELVASGPTITSTLGSRASHILEDHDLVRLLPESVVTSVQRFIPPKVHSEDTVCVVGSPALAAEAAWRYLHDRGFQAQIVTTELTGDVEEVVSELLTGANTGYVSVASGETTVNVTGDGVGGRNQHAALAAAVVLAASDGVFGAFGTDGIDGDTDAAGAIVDGGTVQLAASKGWDVPSELATHNSNGVLSDLGCTIVVGPSGTNVGDVWLWYLRA